MKHRTHPKFPKYRIYADSTIINKRTGHTLRRKYALKIMNESNQRVPVITPKLIAEAFRIPNPTIISILDIRMVISRIGE